MHIRPPLESLLKQIEITNQMKGKMTNNLQFMPKRRPRVGHPGGKNHVQQLKGVCYEKQYLCFIAGGGLTYEPATSTENYRFRFDDHKVEVAEAFHHPIVSERWGSARHYVVSDFNSDLGSNRVARWVSTHFTLRTESNVGFMDTKGFDCNFPYCTHTVVALQMA